LITSSTYYREEGSKELPKNKKKKIKDKKTKYRKESIYSEVRSIGMLADTTFPDITC
jgi:hypothetical protein